MSARLLYAVRLRKLKHSAVESEGCSASISFDHPITSQAARRIECELLLSGHQFGNVVYYVKYCHRLWTLVGRAEKLRRFKFQGTGEK